VINLVLLVGVALTQAAGASDPATCIKTSIRPDGRASGSRVIVGSGNRALDQGALRFLKLLNFSRVSGGVELGQSGYIMVRATGPGTYTFELLGARLMGACPTTAPGNGA
jgi:hypothetical protein